MRFKFTPIFGKERATGGYQGNQTNSEMQGVGSCLKSHIVAGLVN